ncbi:hypothetical protein [Rhizobium laguerreae]|uniref:hypothetical protein n=1 Tax=Rhizobium laguerreae TaxID=1076926 RepID=UPI001C91485E|nr:hypothetical protein [Rhizobium laguerreae]MBY3557296.1 hypothetical protein [Rhizobium laguerreae]
MAEMVINADVSVPGSFGHLWGVPLVYNGGYASGWVAYLGGYGLQFSGETSVTTDSNGTPTGFSVTLDGSFTIFSNGAVVGSGTMPSFTYTSTLSEGDYAVGDGNGGWRLEIHGSPSGATTPLGPFGEFIAALDRIVYNGAVEDDYFDGSYLGTSMLMHGGEGADSLYGAFRHPNQLFGEAGNDTLYGQGVGDHLDGGIGNDYIVDGDNHGDGTIPTPPQDNYNSDTLIGGEGDDYLISTGGGDLLDGGAGNDYLQASNREDADTLIGGLGNDSINGSSGFDTAVFNGSFINYTITQGAPNGFEYTITGIDGTDYIASVERLVFDDRNVDAIVFGTPYDDVVLVAPTSDDVLYGEAGNDVLQGNFGNDWLFGGDGDDALAGQYDVDVLTGGGGKDTFAGSIWDWLGDRITDYEYGEVILVYAGPMAAAGYRLRAGNGETYLEMDADLDGTFNTLLTLSGAIQGTISAGAWDEPGYVRLVIATTSPPSITSDGGGDTAILSIDENTTPVTTIAATDPDASDTLTFSIVGGADSALFEIDSVTGALAFRTAPDFELPTDADADNVYEMIVQVSDGNDGIDTQTIKVALANVSGGVFNGNNSNNVIGGTAEEDTIKGLGGADILSGLAGADTIDGGNGNDTLLGGNGNDVLIGAAGNDRLDGGAGSDAMDGGAGNDTYVVTEIGDTVTELADGGTDTIETAIPHFNYQPTTLGANVENLTFIGIGDFHGMGNSLANRITGGDGGDVLDGAGGDDRLIGRNGNDAYIVDSAGDIVVEAVGGGDRDQVQVTSSSYSLPANVENLIYVGTGAFSGTGNGLANILFGGEDNDSLNGGGGDDVLTGGSTFAGMGADSLSGGSGDDTLHAGFGDDFYFGGSGTDTYDISILPWGNLRSVIDLLQGVATGHYGTDQLSSIENVKGSWGVDTIVASSVRNVMSGGETSSADTFVFRSVAAAGKGANADVISDFKFYDSLDIIDVSAIDANGTQAGDAAFIFAGETLNVSGGFGQLARGQIGYRYQTDTNGIEHTIVEGNVNASPEADFQIDLVGRIQLTAGDFLL